MALGDLHTNVNISMSDIVCSGALFYSLSTQRFLFLHRSNGKRSNAVWGLVGGTNEGKETPWEGLSREITEEIGEVIIKKTIPLETFVSNDTKFKFHTYLCLVDEEFLPTLNKEHDGYAWCSFSKWPKPLHYGLQNTLNKKVNLKKLETVFKVINLLD
jgi:8-oxo-dGTP pyrophosphatase MutT (NUDIX family)|tara:strand:- start:7393 stop:7866 length:474 start_codon:yes stop_codon:yes gene_type:complete